MILLSEIITLLQGAEFNSLAIVEGKGGEARVKRSEYNRIISMVNAGLQVLHQRFELSKNVLYLKTTKGKTTYVLEKSNAISNNQDGFIIDTIENPFEDDILEILSIFSPHGRELLLNSYTEQYVRDPLVLDVDVDCLYTSLYTLDYRTLRIPHNLIDTTLTVTYRSSGKNLKELVDPLNDPIDDIIIGIPASYMNALTYYVASRVYNSKGAETIGRGIFHEGNNYKTSFEQECAQLKAVGFENDVMITDNSNFYNRGFV